MRTESGNVLLPGQGTTDSPEEMMLDRYLDDMFNYLRSGFRELPKGKEHDESYN
ncbi:MULTISPECIES: hypothetical protein [unclassified Paenibacillus]|uniref:hypothetical protein n=1 Tax=unclassified Paenibacillus TaxID=185978 RepID=UPI000403AFF9|nr:MULTISPECIES: hypothetical protein [unclassified Paenibacillus]